MSTAALKVDMQVALKCADIGHLAATPDVHKRWALLLEEEFFIQVDYVILQLLYCTSRTKNLFLVLCMPNTAFAVVLVIACIS